MVQRLAQNALTGVVLHGLLTTSDTDNVLPKLQRVALPSDLVDKWLLTTRHDSYTLDDAPSRPLSQLPTPCQQQLEATLGQPLGYGRSSVVYSLEDVRIPGLEPGTVVPPLVVKIARLHRLPWLTREAWFYEDMECLQGSVVPYCYGMFEMELGNQLDESSNPRFSIPALDKHPVPIDAHNDTELEYFECHGVHPLFENQIKRRDTLSVLILERVGGMLPLGKKVSQETSDEIESLHSELATLGVVLWCDIRRENVLRAPASPPGLPSLPSPLHKREYTLRLIDFEFAVKTNFSQLGCRWIYGTQCTDMIVRISRGWGTVYPEDEALFDEEEEEDSSDDEVDEDEDEDKEEHKLEVEAKYESGVNYSGLTVALPL